MIPQIYDFMSDETRDVTQEDVDELVNVRRAYGSLRTQLISDMAKAQAIASGDELYKPLADHLTDQPTEL